MTDQEQRLIEFAAKMCELDVVFAGEYKVFDLWDDDLEQWIIWNPLTDHNQFAQCQATAIKQRYQWTITQDLDGAFVYAYLYDEDGELVRDSNSIAEYKPTVQEAWFLAMEQVWPK